MTQPNPVKWFKTSPEIIRLAVMLYVRCPLSLRNVEDLLHERDVEISHETVRFSWRVGDMPAPDRGAPGFGSGRGCSDDLFGALVQRFRTLLTKDR